MNKAAEERRDEEAREAITFALHEESLHAWQREAAGRIVRGVNRNDPAFYALHARRATRKRPCWIWRPTITRGSSEPSG